LRVYGSWQEPGDVADTYRGSLVTRCSKKTITLGRRHPMDKQMVQDKVEVQGTCDDRFRAIYDVLERQLNNGDDIGSSAAVFIDGEPVVGIWGGYIDEARTRPWGARHDRQHLLDDEADDRLVCGDSRRPR
jgi:hypothetical protein